jgi:hypothetical protein
MAGASLITRPREFLESLTHANWKALGSITKKENPLFHQVEVVSWSALFDLLFSGVRREKRNIPERTHLADRGLEVDPGEGLQQGL